MLGARIATLQDGRAIPSLLFLFTDKGQVEFQTYPTECGPDVPDVQTTESFRQALSECSRSQIDTPDPLIGDAVCHDR